MPNENIMNQGMTIHIKIRIFKFYCEFNIGNGTKTFTNKFWYTNWWNGNNCVKFKNLRIKGDFIRLNAIMETTNTKQQKSEIQKFKHELKKLPFYGSSVCLEGTIFSSRSVKGKVHFEINLMHESNEDHPEVGDIILKIEFFFSPTYNETFIEMSNRFFGGSMINIKKFSNPIGQPGVKFTVRIYVTKKAFEIQINNGKDYVSFDHVAPPWMVKGYVKDVHFDKEAKRCQIIKGMPLPPFITQIDPEKPLKEGNYISIKGKLMEMNENVEINFYHESLGWNKKRCNELFISNKIGAKFKNRQ
uniref:Galectin n=1 Tax=Meloidogyne hapla TaxID=6305 RepID=A0A1I8BCI6_MELHA